jgi:hypothetical protein
MTRLHPIARSFLTNNGTLEKTMHRHFIASPEQIEYREYSTNQQLTVLNVIKFLQYTLSPFYEQKDLHLDHDSLFCLMQETISNLMWHGGNREPHYSTIEILASPNGILTKCSDNGNYFRKQRVKKAWETKEFFPEKHTGELDSPEMNNPAASNGVSINEIA